MDDNMQISGARALDFLKMFDFVREAGTCGEQAAAGKIRSYLEQNVSGPGITLREEPFSFEESRILEACLEVTEPYQKAYRAVGCVGCGSTPECGVEAPFLYVENGDSISLAYAKGKIVLVNGTVGKEMYQRLTDAGAAGFVMLSGTPIDEGEDLRPARRSLRG